MKEPQLLQPQMLLAGDDGLKEWPGEVPIESLTGGGWNGLTLVSDREQVDDAQTHLQRNSQRSYEKFRSWNEGKPTATKLVQPCLMGLQP